MTTTAKTPPNPPINLQQVEVRPLGGEEEKLKSSALLDAHHYLKDMHAVGERIRYGFFDAAGQMPITPSHRPPLRFRRSPLLFLSLVNWP